MITLQEIKNTLDNSDSEYLETLAQKAKDITQQYFGRTVGVYAPIYLSNFCSSSCTYCGFSNQHKINRKKLTFEQMHEEMAHVAKQGIENILLLTGESYQATPLSYLKEAVSIAKQYFTSICLEVHPMTTEEYHDLYVQGVDSITIYQETYDRDRYKEVHLSGKKADFDFRYNAPERIASAGIRQISLGILLGLGPLEEDILSLYQHLRFLERKFPGVEYSISFPRLRTIKGEEPGSSNVTDTELIKIICLTRTFFPRVGINLSTRESSFLRDNALALGVTRISAGSNTAVGGYSLDDAEEQDPQFDIEDNRSIEEIISLLKERNFDPILTDWRRIENF